MESLGRSPNKTLKPRANFDVPLSRVGEGLFLPNNFHFHLTVVMADVAVVEKPSTAAVEPPLPAASASNPADADLDDLGCSLWIYGNLDLRLW